MARPGEVPRTSGLATEGDNNARTENSLRSHERHHRAQARQQRAVAMRIPETVGTVRRDAMDLGLGNSGRQHCARWAQAPRSGEAPRT
ncbi:hypothetical protein EVAR_19686_1 [Eumeta japonica]|uniref:Uncharacterized protein n=1 Tax=Eumeta variegata TaxID=151549 RepID=A0A4C1V484_EUMVA|nr:hypothetical protein EVAR_19686_1 [Eumeta japonica]